MSSSAGKVLILPKGEYNNATQYQMLDAVRYNGSLYIAKKTTIGHVPADGEYWMLSAIGASDIHWGDITGSIANQSDLINALDAKQNVLTFDSTPTASSNNPVTSAGIKTALDTKQNTLTFDTTPTSGSTNPVTSDGIFTAVNATASNLATIESSTTASQAYSTGDYLVLNGQLYEVIADIASGETLVVGTNISARTVGEELTALNAGLTAEEFTLISNQGNAYTGYGIYFPQSKTVIIQFRGNTSGNVGMNVPLMFVPEAYRPKADKEGSAFAYTDSQGTSLLLYLNHTTGAITQEGTGYLRRILGVIFYTID